ncbi:unnamed protein product [Ectocarpus sp. 12 AP-2014]
MVMLDLIRVERCHAETLVVLGTRPSESGHLKVHPDLPVSHWPWLLLWDVYSSDLEPFFADWSFLQRPRFLGMPCQGIVRPTVVCMRNGTKLLRSRVRSTYLRRREFSLFSLYTVVRKARTLETASLFRFVP